MLPGTNLRRSEMNGTAWKIFVVPCAFVTPAAWRFIAAGGFGCGVLYFVSCFVFISFETSWQELPWFKELGGKDNRCLCVCVLGTIPMTYERGTGLTHIKWQVSYVKYLGCKVACIWQWVPTRGWGESAKEGQKIEGKKFTFRKCCKLIGSKRVSLYTRRISQVHWNIQNSLSLLWNMGALCTHLPQRHLCL